MNPKHELKWGSDVDRIRILHNKKLVACMLDRFVHRDEGYKELKLIRNKKS